MKRKLGFTPLEIIKTGRKNKKSLTGFTLVELLVALSIFAVIAICLYSIFAGGINLWRRQETGFKYNQGVTLAFGKMAKELRNVIIYSQPQQTAQQPAQPPAQQPPAQPQQQPAQQSAQPQTPSFTGEEDSMSFMTVIPPDIAKVTYIFESAGQEQGRLVRKVVLQKEGFKDESLKEDTLIDGISSLLFEYAYASGNEDSPVTWKNSWQDPSKVPAGVRITLEFKKGTSDGAAASVAKEILKKTIFIPSGTFSQEGGQQAGGQQ